MVLVAAAVEDLAVVELRAIGNQGRNIMGIMRLSDARAFLSEAACNDISDCIAEVEKKTSAEIKVLVVAASSWLPRLSQKDQEIAVQKRAIKEYKLLGIGNTRDDTGVLIMISLEERKVRVLAGEAINLLVPPTTWATVANCITDSIKTNLHAKGICAAINNIGMHLTEYFPIKPDDTNEISNSVVIKGR